MVSSRSSTASPGRKPRLASRSPFSRETSGDACPRGRCRLALRITRTVSARRRQVAPAAPPLAISRAEPGRKRPGVATRHRSLSLGSHTSECRVGGPSRPRRNPVLRDGARRIVSRGTAARSAEEDRLQLSFRATLPERSAIHPCGEPSRDRGYPAPRRGSAHRRRAEWSSAGRRRSRIATGRAVCGQTRGSGTDRCSCSSADWIRGRRDSTC